MRAYKRFRAGTIERPRDKRIAVRGFGIQTKPGVSYSCAHGRHGGCAKAKCTCPCGHGEKATSRALVSRADVKQFK
jgi:hypothetical protein